MPYKHIVTEDKLNEIIANAERDEDKDADGIRDMYMTPGEAVGRVIKNALHWGHTFVEITDVDMDGETVTMEELFTGEEYTASTDDAFDVPFIGSTFTVEWIEARVDGEWERVSNYKTPASWRGPAIPRDESYDDTRHVKKTYTHRTDEFDEWDLRIDRQTGEACIIPDAEDIINADALETLYSSIELPDDTQLNGLSIGSVYTKEHIVETDDGHERKHEIVWWQVNSQFQSTDRYNSVSPVTELDRRPTA